jgi:hypothetical protein
MYTLFRGLAIEGPAAVWCAFSNRFDQSRLEDEIIPVIRVVAVISRPIVGLTGPISAVIGRVIAVLGRTIRRMAFPVVAVVSISDIAAALPAIAAVVDLDKVVVACGIDLHRCGLWHGLA